MSDSVQVELEAVLRGIEATVAPHDADCIAAHSPHCDCTRPDRVRAEQARTVKEFGEALIAYIGEHGFTPSDVRDAWAAALRAVAPNP